MLESMLNYIPEAAKSSTAAILYVCALLAWGILAWRVQRNRNLLQNLEKLPPADRIKALTEEMGRIPPPGLSANQWIRQRQHAYYYRAILVAMILIAALAGLAVYLSSISPSKESIVKETFGLSSSLEAVQSVNSKIVDVSQAGRDLARISNRLRVSLEPGGKKVRKKSKQPVSCTTDLTESAHAFYASWTLAWKAVDNKQGLLLKNAYNLYVKYLVYVSWSKEFFKNEDIWESDASLEYSLENGVKKNFTRLAVS